MIRLPRRSVTRFFIPMIDVLTLLFCMFLLMPIIRENETLSQDLPGADELEKRIETQKKELKELDLDRDRALAILRELADKKRDLVRQNVLIRLLYVSPKDGSLQYFDPIDLKQPALSIGDSAAASRLIAKHKQEAGERELLYIFQEPRLEGGEVAPYPTRPAGSPIQGVVPVGELRWLRQTAAEQGGEMMSFSFGDDIQQWLFLGFRALAAAGGFIAGFLLAPPVARLLWRLAFHRPVPASTLAISRWVGGLLLAVVIFFCLPLGWGGGGGGGSGGGKGKGVGPYSGDGGVEISGKKGTGEADPSKIADQTQKPKALPGTDVLAIELLGGDAVKEGKYYLIDRKTPAVDVSSLTKYLDENLQSLAAIDIILTEKSVGESHQAVRQLQSMAQDRKLRSLLVIPK